MSQEVRPTPTTLVITPVEEAGSFDHPVPGEVIVASDYTPDPEPNVTFISRAN